MAQVRVKIRDLGVATLYLYLIVLSYMSLGVCGDIGAFGWEVVLGV